MTHILLNEGASQVVTWSDLSSIVTAITSQFSVSTIVAVIAGIVGASIGFVFLWWGARKAYSKITKAAKRGKGGV